jgi:hypothetical protein
METNIKKKNLVKGEKNLRWILKQLDEAVVELAITHNSLQEIENEKYKFIFRISYLDKNRSSPF